MHFHITLTISCQSILMAEKLNFGQNLIFIDFTVQWHGADFHRLLHISVSNQDPNMFHRQVWAKLQCKLYSFQAGILTYTWYFSRVIEMISNKLEQQQTLPSLCNQEMEETLFDIQSKNPQSLLLIFDYLLLLFFLWQFYFHAVFVRDLCMWKIIQCVWEAPLHLTV